jgi:hypothetical protein
MLPVRAELFLEGRHTDLTKGTRLKITEEAFGGKKKVFFS